MDAWKVLSIFDTAATFLWSRTFLIDAWHMVSVKASQVSFHSQAKTITSPLKHPTLILHPTRQSDVIAHLGCLVGRFSEKLLGRHRFGNGPRHHKHRENPQNSHPESAAVAFILKDIVWKLLKMSHLFNIDIFYYEIDPSGNTVWLLVSDIQYLAKWTIFCHC